MMPFNVLARVKNMTRETRLGLAVSCSFLVLLGVVLALKMTERPEEEPGADAAASAPSEPKSPAPVVAQQTQPPQEPARLPIKDANVLPVVGSADPPAPPPKAGGPKPPPPSATDSGLPDLPGLSPLGSLRDFWANAVIAAKLSRPVVAAPAPSPPPVADLPPALPLGSLRDFWANVDRARAKKSAPTTTADVPPLPPVPGAPDVPPLPPVPAPDKPKVADATPPLPPLPGDDVGKPAVKKAGTGGWFALAKAGGAPAGGASPPPLPALPGGAAGNTGGAAPPPPPPLAPEKKDTLPPPPPPPDLPPAGGAGKAGTAVTGAPAKTQDTLPTIDVQGIEAGAGGGKPIKVGAETKPPADTRPAPAKETAPIVVGVKPSASVPPLSLPSAPPPRPTQPDVVSYDEEAYGAAAGDTFRSISKTKYGTEDYAQALYLFNRSHPLAGDELLQSDALKAGQTVYVPPAAILKGRYGAAAGGGATSPGVAVGSTSRRADVSAAAPQTYRVAAGGEKVYDIARRLLGDGNRWVEIEKLNPGWNWEVPLPAGLNLQVPADARLPQ